MFTHPGNLWASGWVMGAVASSCVVVCPLAYAGDCPGEDCNQPVLIDPNRALPILLSGNTENCLDHLFADCGFSSRGGRDTVYLFQPARDLLVTLSLCSGTGQTTFDTKLFIYDHAPCTGVPWRCNEDACYDGNQPGVSEIKDVVLLAGKSYYIVVDGNDAGAYGDYRLEIRESQPAQPCPAGSYFTQTPHGPAEAWSMGVSEAGAGVARFDRVRLPDPNVSVCLITWWGLQLSDEGGWHACDEPNTPFQIRVYAPSTDPNHAGEPDPNALLFEQAARVWMIDTQVKYQDWPLLRYEAQLWPCFTAGGIPAEPRELWVSITGLGDPRCAFYWLSSPLGEGASCLQDGSGLRCGVPGESDYDLSLCLAPVKLGTCCRERGLCELLTEYECVGDPICRGDANCDGRINFADINPFVAALSGAQPCRFANADANADGKLTFSDINPFVTLLSQYPGPCPGTRWWDPERSCQDCPPEPAAEGAGR